MMDKIIKLLENLMVDYNIQNTEIISLSTNNFKK